MILRVHEEHGPSLAIIVHSHDYLTELWEEVLPAASEPALAHRVRQILAEEKVTLLGKMD